MRKWVKAGVVVVAGAAAALFWARGGGEPMRYGARSFSSTVGLEVRAQLQVGGEFVWVGKTPGTVQIPDCQDWWVMPVGATSVAEAAREVRSQGLPGLRLRLASDEELASLGELPALESLYLESPQITDGELEHLGGLTGLTFLSLNGTAITDGGLVHVRALRNLAGLDLSGTQVSDVGQLADMPKLVALNLWGTRVNGLGKFPAGLESLDLGGTQLGEGALGNLATLAELQTLSLAHTGVSDAGLASLKEMRALRTLNLGHTGITGAGVENLTGLKGLRTLDLTWTQVKRAELERIRAELPGTNVVGD